MTVRTTPLLALLLLAAGVAEAQKLELAVSDRGPAALVTLTAEDTSAHEILVRLAAATGLPLKAEGEALAALQSESPRVHVKDLALADVVDHVAGAAGLEGRLDHGGIVAAPLPAAGDRSCSPVLRTLAIRAFERAALSPQPGSATAFGFRIALLRLAGGEQEAALAGFRVFFEKEEAHPLAPQARLYAAATAMTLGREAEARVILEDLETRHPGVPEMLTAQLLLARCYLHAGLDAEALVRLHHVISNAATARLKVLAMIQLAEMHYRRHEPREALDALAGFDTGFQRELPDLASRVPFYTGLCLLQAEEPARAVPHLQLATLAAEEPEFRARAAAALVRAYLTLGDHTTAVLAAEVAQRMPLPPPLRLQTMALLAELHGALGVPVLAERSFRQILAEVQDDHPAWHGAAEGLARLLFRDRRYAEARELYNLLADRAEAGADFRIMSARCEMGLKDWRRALEALNAIEDARDGGQSVELARLRGRCWMELGDYARASLAFQGVKEDQ